MANMIDEKTLFDTAYQLLKLAMLEIPDDVREAYKQIRQGEKGEARKSYDIAFKGITISKDFRKPLCCDSGVPSFFIKMPLGTVDPKINLAAVMKKATKKATRTSILRPTLISPLTRTPALTNTGENVPLVVYKLKPNLDYVEITAVPRGGGGSFGTKFCQLAAADGERGVRKFALETVIEGAMIGKTCPPIIVGIGIGGTPSMPLTLAEQAAILRPIGNRHPNEEIARLELDLLRGINMTGIGHMGLGGNVTAMDVHIEYSLGYSQISIGVFSQCFVVRRATARVYSDRAVEFGLSPKWIR